jgi:hypothetical protein
VSVVLKQDLRSTRTNFNEIREARTSSVVQWSEFLATDPENPGSIPDATRFSEKYWVWNGVHSAS